MIRWLHNLLVKVRLRPRAEIVLSLRGVKKVEGGVRVIGEIAAYGGHADLVFLVRNLLNDPSTKDLVIEAMFDSVIKDLDRMKGLLGEDLTKKMKSSIRPENTPEA